MSARDLRVPNRALLHSLNGIIRRLTTLEHRVRWPGATQSIQAAPTNLTWQDVDTWTPTYTTLATLTLERGRWTLFGGASITLTQIFDETNATVLMRLRLAGSVTEDQIIEHRVTTWFSFPTGVGPSGAVTINSDTSVTATVAVAVGSPTSGIGVPVASNSFLVAVPG